MIIKAAKSILNSDKICRSYGDFNFGVTFLEHGVYLLIKAIERESFKTFGSRFHARVGLQQKGTSRHRSFLLLSVRLGRSWGMIADKT